MIVQRTVSEKHLQAYLSAIAYRFNHRFWKKELFDRLIQACATPLHTEAYKFTLLI